MVFLLVVFLALLSQAGASAPQSCRDKVADAQLDCFADVAKEDDATSRARAELRCRLMGGCRETVPPTGEAWECDSMINDCATERLADVNCTARLELMELMCPTVSDESVFGNISHLCRYFADCSERIDNFIGTHDDDCLAEYVGCALEKDSERQTCDFDLRKIQEKCHASLYDESERRGAEKLMICSELERCADAVQEVRMDEDCYDNLHQCAIEEAANAKCDRRRVLANERCRREGKETEAVCDAMMDCHDQPEVMDANDETCYAAYTTCARRHQFSCLDHIVYLQDQCTSGVRWSDYPANNTRLSMSLFDECTEMDACKDDVGVKGAQNIIACDLELRRCAKHRVLGTPCPKRAARMVGKCLQYQFPGGKDCYYTEVCGEKKLVRESTSVDCFQSYLTCAKETAPQPQKDPPIPKAANGTAIFKP